MRLLGHGFGVNLGLLIARLGFGNLAGYVNAELLCVDLVERRVSLDLCVQNRLRDGRVVDLRVPVAAVADEIDDHVRAKLVPVFERKPADANHCFGVFRVDVEDWNGQALGKVAGVASAGVVAGVGGKAEQVIDDDVDGAADLIARQIAHVEGLGPYTLAGKCGVAVHEDGQGLALALLAAPGLLGAHPSHRDRIDSLKMAGVADQMNPHALAVEISKASGALMIFHVSAAQGRARVDVLKAGVDIDCRAAHGDTGSGEASAMAHRHHTFLSAMRGGSGENLLHHRNQGGVAFQREALGADVKRLQHLLEDVGLKQLLENGFAIDLGLRAFQPVDNPLPALGVGNVHELSADRAAVNLPCALGVRATDSQLGIFKRGEMAEGIEVGLQISPAAEKVKNAFLRLIIRADFNRRRNDLSLWHCAPRPA